VFGQGTGFVTTGSDRLRSKSLDRNSFNSGDWFNQIRWDCAQGNGFGVGLPPAADNRDKWPFARPLLANPDLVPGCDAINLAAMRFQELLAIRRGTVLFDLATVEEVQERLSFPLAGPHATPGVITMVLDGEGLDPRWRTVIVIFYACPWTVAQSVDGLRGAPVIPHPIQAASADPLARESAFDQGSGTFAVPGRTVAVHAVTMNPA
jgi:pullulanase/glycogen debranching enzyme